MDHAAIISPLQPGKLTLSTSDGQSLISAISGGMVQVNRNKVIILGDAIEAKEEIDVAELKQLLSEPITDLKLPAIQ